MPGWLSTRPCLLRWPPTFRPLLPAHPARACNCRGVAADGYNLGHHRLPDNKFNSYMHDLRIPFLIRGPGISGHQLRPEIITQVDFAPTFLG